MTRSLGTLKNLATKARYGALYFLPRGPSYSDKSKCIGLERRA
jgi:hypothetical protein